MADKQEVKVQTTRQLLIFCLCTALSSSAYAGPEEDRIAFQAYFQTRFPDVPLADYINGIYALDEGARRQWVDIEEFPPYEFAVETGELLFGQIFRNGNS